MDPEEASRTRTATDAPAVEPAACAGESTAPDPLDSGTTTPPHGDPFSVGSAPDEILPESSQLQADASLDTGKATPPQGDPLAAVEFALPEAATGSFEPLAPEPLESGTEPPTLTEPWKAATAPTAGTSWFSQPLPAESLDAGEATPPHGDPLPVVLTTAEAPQSLVAPSVPEPLDTGAFTPPHGDPLGHEPGSPFAAAFPSDPLVPEPLDTGETTPPHGDPLSPSPVQDAAVAPLSTADSHFPEHAAPAEPPTIPSAGWVGTVSDPTGMPLTESSVGPRATTFEDEPFPTASYSYLQQAHEPIVDPNAPVA